MERRYWPLDIAYPQIAAVVAQAGREATAERRYPSKQLIHLVQSCTEPMRAHMRVVEMIVHPDVRAQASGAGGVWAVASRLVNQAALHKWRPDTPTKGNMADCGTHGGYNRHVRHGHPPCDPCRDAANVYQRQRRAAQPKTGRRLAECGTMSAYKRHLRWGEQPDDQCRQAARDEWAARRRRRGQPERATDLCGTISGPNWHRRRGEPVCDNCKTVFNAYQREYRRTRRGLA